MERSVQLTSFEADDHQQQALEYWLSRPPEERLAEVDRLRHEYMCALGGAERDGVTPGLQRVLLLVERQER